MALKTYDELHGNKNWEGLLDPLDHDLRSLILSYGDLSSAAERAFNNDEGSKFCGYSHFGKSSFFKGVMLPWADAKYNVTSFIYATASIDLPLLIPRLSSSVFQSNWMGYIAVSTDEFTQSTGRREICVVWRGTSRTYEWLDDIVFAKPVPAHPLLPPVHGAFKDKPLIMDGWLRVYNTSDPNSEFLKTSARTQVLGKIRELLVKYKNEKVSITCTGHSLGACLALLSAVDIAVNVATPGINVSAFVFESPQVGNEAFRKKIEELENLKVMRVKNVSDIIPFWPSKLLKWVQEKTWVSVPSDLLEYVDVGVEILVDSKKSPYLKDESGVTGMMHPMVFHNLECVLHTLGGWTGENAEFDWSLMKRDLGLVNMWYDILKEEFKIPISWWGENNKGMMLNDNGNWILSPIDLNDHDLPVYVSCSLSQLVESYVSHSNFYLPPLLLLIILLLLLNSWVVIKR